MFSLHSLAVTILLSGSVVTPDAPEVARALRLAARAGTGVFVFAQADIRPESFTLEDGLSVSYSQTTDKSLVNILSWRKAFYLALIARQQDLLAELGRISYQLLVRSSTGGGSELGYRFVDMLKAVWAEPKGFTQHPVFIQYEAYCTSGPKGQAPNKYVERMTAPLLRVLRRLEQGDSNGFEISLREAATLHKKHWTSTDPLRKDFEGFVSLPLTAVAALAWDRGLRFRVENDYLPWSWVTGELFAEKPEK